MENEPLALTINLLEHIDIAKALASVPRARILSFLKGAPMNINELAEKMALPQSTVATNVAILEKAGLVSTECTKGRKGIQKRCAAAFAQVHLCL